jgi:hypothetical protein
LTLRQLTIFSRERLMLVRRLSRDFERLRLLGELLQGGSLELACAAIKPLAPTASAAITRVFRKNVFMTFSFFELKIATGTRQRS